MSRDDVIESLVRDIMDLQSEVARLSAAQPLFSILNQKLIETISSDQNNYPPGDYDEVFLSTTANRIIRGITGGVAGRVLYIRNVSSFNFSFTNQDAAATAGNRITTTTLGTIVVPPRVTGIFHYIGQGANLWLMIYPIA